MMEMTKAKALKVETGQPVRSFEVNEKGVVSMREELTNSVDIEGREFLTFYREHVDELDRLKYQLSDEFKEKVESEIVKLESQIEVMKPIVAESERNYAYNFLRERLFPESGDVNVDYVLSLVDNMDQELKEGLPSDLKSEIAKLRAKVKRKGRK